MPGYLILHGVENHRPPAHWQFWLAAQLAADGHEVHYPGLPDPDRPRFEVWRREVEALLDVVAPGGGTVICHSLSSLLWCVLAPELAPHRRPARVLLAALPAGEAVPASGADFVRPWSPAAVPASASAELRLVGSDRDPYNPAGAAAEAARIGCPVDLLPGAGHITPDDGYGPWPQLLDWCRGVAPVVAPNR